MTAFANLIADLLIRTLTGLIDLALSVGSSTRPQSHGVQPLGGLARPPASWSARTARARLRRRHRARLSGPPISAVAGRGQRAAARRPALGQDLDRGRAHSCSPGRGPRSRPRPRRSWSASPAAIAPTRGPVWVFAPLGSRHDLDRTARPARLRPGIRSPRSPTAAPQPSSPTTSPPVASAARPRTGTSPRPT